MIYTLKFLKERPLINSINKQAQLHQQEKNNNVDPHERIDIDNASGVYTITESHKSSLTDGSLN